jgi:hypothetical protein
VSYTRARGESVGVLCKVGVMQRAERMLLLGIASILDPWVCASRGWSPGTVVAFSVAVIALGTLWTSIHRTIWIARALKEVAAPSTTLRPLETCRWFALPVQRLYSSGLSVASLMVPRTTLSRHPAMCTRKSDKTPAYRILSSHTSIRWFE